VRILVFGGWGQLGTDLALASEGRHDLMRPRRSDVDITDADAVRRAIAEGRPDVVVDAAAFHKVEACEQQPAAAFAVNAVGASTVARATEDAGARCAFVSTDYVFDGANEAGYVEADAPRPVNVYGVTKAAGERLVELAAPGALIVRASGLFGHAGSSGKGGNFIETMLAMASRGESISVVEDRTFSPTSTADLARRLLLLLESGRAEGIYHLANAGSCSWFELARATFELAGIPADLSPRASRPDEVPRPRSSVLLDTRTEAAGLPPAPPWRDALSRYLTEREHRADRMVTSPDRQG
jgi:dTDP-4-dehydrorhamnose reductase